MKSSEINSTNALDGNEGKDKQINRVFHAFYQRAMTTMEVSHQTNINRANICRYVASLRNESRIFFIRKRRCTVTQFPNVSEFTTNKDLFPIDGRISQ